MASEKVSEEMWKLIHAYNERGERLKQAMEIVRAVAALREPRTDARYTWECSFCGAYLIAHDHESDCLVLKACALPSNEG